MLKATSPAPFNKGQMPAAQWSDTRERNPQVPEHEMGSSDPTQTTGHQNSNTDNGLNGTCTVA